jgi:putative phage-type endonuclease
MSDVVQGTDAWFAERAGYASASRFEDVMTKGRGNSPSATRQKYIDHLVVEALTQKPLLKNIKSAAMERGTEREPFARMAFEAATGKIVNEVGFIKHPYLKCGASPDGLIDDDEGIEIKSPDADTHLRYLELTDSPPDDYEWQVHGGMYVTGRKVWNFVSYHPDFPPELKLHIVRVHRDEAKISALHAEMSKFLAEVKLKTDRMLQLAQARAAGGAQ